MMGESLTEVLDFYVGIVLGVATILGVALGLVRGLGHGELIKKIIKVGLALCVVALLCIAFIAAINTDWHGLLIPPTEKSSTESTAIPTATLMDTPTDKPTVKPAANAATYSNNLQAGDYITFGYYPQTATGTDNTPIEWLVLEVDTKNNKALLISKYGLDAKPYNADMTSVTWESCTLRKWLNEDFRIKAFSAEEQKAILTTTVDNSNGQCYSGWSTNGGNNTQDQVFLLSYAEVNNYFGVQHQSVLGSRENQKSRVAVTAYSIEQGAYTSSGFNTTDGAAAGWWWLRSPGSTQSGAAGVYIDGALCDGKASYTFVSVRPARWLNLDAGSF